jgi:hypothetical protein
MSWQLLVTEGADKGRTFTLLDDGVTTIGSSRSRADVSLNDLYVHRTHCEIEVSGGSTLLRALDPSCPVLVRDHKVTEHELQSGDIFRIGNTYLRFEPLAATGDAVESGEYSVEIVDDDTATAPTAEAPVLPAGGVTAPTAPAVSPVAARPAAAAPPLGQEPAPVAVATPLPHLPAERLAELTGHILAHYEVGRVLGKGSSGVVFLARNRKTSLEVALRVLAPPFPANDGEMQAFIGALRVALPLRHRHLVSMWNAGRAGPYCWLAVDYVDGPSLAQVLKEVNPPGKLAWKHSLRLGVHVARALNYLACRKLSHGNVTPSNILIRTSDKCVRLGDLMMTKVLAGSCLGKATHHHRLLTELPYWSPEQASPRPVVDIRSDLYSLGACMYARCTGRPPFLGHAPEETVQLIHKAPLPLLQQYQPAIPDSFEEVVVRLLDRRPEDRYDAPATLIADLESIAEAEGVEI